MEEIKSITLREGDAEILLRAAELMDRLEADYPHDVLFDSCDQYYVSFRSAARHFRLLASSGIAKSEDGQATNSILRRGLF